MKRKSPCEHGQLISKCVTCVAAWHAIYDRKYREPREKKRRIRDLKRFYDMTPEDVDVLFESQGRACAICGTKTFTRKIRQVLDHIHGTRIVRGILCDFCNKLLGCARDNPIILRAAADYVEKF